MSVCEGEVKEVWLIFFNYLCLFVSTAFTFIINLVRMDWLHFVMNIKITADMKATLGIFNDDIINRLIYSVDHYSSIILRTIQNENECHITDKCHAEAHIPKIRALVRCLSATGKTVFNIGVESVVMLMAMISYSWSGATDFKLLQWRKNIFCLS